MPINVTATPLLVGGLFVILCASVILVTKPTLILKSPLQLLHNKLRGAESVLKDLVLAVQDFRSGAYYVPERNLKQEYVYVRSRKHLVELAESPQLSQRAVYNDIFGFGLALPDVAQKRPGLSTYRLFGRVLKVLNQPQLHVLYPRLRRWAVTSISAELNISGAGKEWVSVRMAPMARKVVSDTLSLIFFGEALSKEVRFSSACKSQVRELEFTLMALRVTPSFMKPMVHGIITGRGRAMRVITDRLLPIIKSEHGAWVEPHDQKELSILYQTIQVAAENQWTTAQILRAITGLWLSAAFQPWMNLDLLILELCVRPAYIELLRAEIKSEADLSYSNLEKLPLLNSFIKETFRTNPLDTFTLRRKALEPFTFSDGLHVPAGRVACLSAQDIMNDEVNYLNPEIFDGSRFVNAAQEDVKIRDQGSDSGFSNFTDVTDKFPIWGYGSLACPGRFHASLVIKLVLVHLVMNYEFRLEDVNAPRLWNWQNFTVPYDKTRVEFRRRSI